ncbi:hypothetical protein [Streptomyces erythrochromogenes]|uniref:hypothetical protein n=1 Tax=Streptomyces erythrochromogenes TaxID=285574 RepID=UPI00386A5285|nr:hypothetical protein OG364_36320 [Streptomyces erythrochromogenes]
MTGQPPLTPALSGSSDVERFETTSLPLMPGRRVRAKVLSHQPWGLLVAIAGYEDAGISASVDMIALYSGTAIGHDDLLALFPPVGSEIDAVVQQVRRSHPPASIRLSILPADLECFTWPCEFCGERAVVSPGGDAVVLDVRSNDGPGSLSMIAHRHCLAERIRPENGGERLRVLGLGRG